MGEEEARPVCRHPSACPTGPCRRGEMAWRPSKTTLKEEEKEKDEEKKEDDDDKEQMEGKRRDEEDKQDSLVVEEGMIVKFPLVPFATCLLPLQLLLQDSFHQEEVKQTHLRYTQRPKIMNYVVHPEAPDHLPLTTLTSLTEQCNHCGIKLLWKVQPVTCGP